MNSQNQLFNHTKFLFWGMLFAFLISFPLKSTQARDCVCHNIKNNPHTICVGDAGFVKHLFGHLHIENDTPGPCCGNGTCEDSDGEDCSSCPKDCGSCGPQCGDGDCDDGEDCSSCSADCGACCGDGFCDEEIDENCTSCDVDCGECEADCGNNVREEGEECDDDDNPSEICEEMFGPGVLCNQAGGCICMRCGNGSLAEGEECEFDEEGNEIDENQCPTGESCGPLETMNACLCVSDSILNCGNGTLDDGEECDGSLDDRCEGRNCLPNCQCEDPGAQTPGDPRTAEGSGCASSLTQASPAPYGALILLGIACISAIWVRVQRVKKGK